ncbi:MAG: ABC transporter ATP-binding protein [Acholeplasmataceae bacterium]|jgi:ABC-type uncharacterized transport system ATPase subunit
MDYILEMRNITKVFPGIKANDNVTFQLRKGEIHALLGENGSGKTTLMNCLFGIYKQEEGDIYIRGEKVNIDNPHQAYALNIGMVHQHFRLVNTFSVIDNIILGNEDSTMGFIKRKEARQKVEDISKRYGLEVDLDALVSDITVGMQQRVEILKILYRDAEILIFDEPTAVLTPGQIDALMETMRQLKNEGKSIIFISHKLDEIMAITDRVSVLKTGQYIGTVNTAETTPQELSQMMVGRTIKFDVPREKVETDEVVLSIKDLDMVDHRTEKKLLDNISFDVKAGEILAIAGIDGNGQNELVESITGLLKGATGSIKLGDVELIDLSIRERTESGLSHIPEDRHKHGLVLDYPVDYNAALQEYYKEPFSKSGLLKFDVIREHSDELIEKFDIRSALGSRTIARSMSGGNQQKVILAREISRDTKLIIAVQPTRGLDVGAIDYVHKALINERNNGRGILLVSFELDEVFKLSDRVLVMFEGRVTAEVDPKETTYEEIGLYMSGGKV